MLRSHVLSFLRKISVEVSVEVCIGREAPGSRGENAGIFSRPRDMQSWL